jgi:HlyD family secretion protein
MQKLVWASSVLGVLTIAALYARLPERASRAAPNEIATVQAVRGPLIVSTLALGTVKPAVGAEIKIGSRLSGVVAELRVGIGDEVAEGDLLALLEDSETRARVAALEAELAEAVARADYARVEADALQKIEYIAAIERVKAAKEVTVLQASVDRIKANLDAANIQLGYTRILSPLAGTIASVSTYEGETVAASFAAPTFVTIIDLRRLEVHAYVDETDVGRVRTGQTASFRVDAYPDRELKGVVRTIYPQAELVNNVVNYVAVIEILGEEHSMLRPEMTAHVTFTLDERVDATTIPRSALLREGGAGFVVEKTPDGWRRTAVETGLSTPQRIEILSGIGKGAVIAADAQRWRESLTKETS